MSPIPPNIYSDSTDKHSRSTKILFVLRWVFLTLAIAILLMLAYYRIAHSRLLHVEKLPSEQAVRLMSLY